MLISTGSFIIILNGGNAIAAQETTQSLSLSSSVHSAIATYTFNFVPATTGPIQGLEFQACTTAIGTCTVPAGFNAGSETGGTVTNWTNATNFTVDAIGANNCTPGAYVICAKRTQAANESASGVHTITFSNITNPSASSCSTANCTFFIRMTTYSSNTYTTGSIVDTGTMAASTTQVLTVNATIQEQLAFCIGNTTVDNATTAPPTCSTITGTSLNLGTLNSSNISISPVATANNGDANNGLAELSTNADQGASVSYNAIQQSGTNHLGTLRVAGATCTSTNSVTDQCINSIGVTKATLTAGTENFGMTVAGVNCGNVGSAYTCNFSTGTTNLTRAANYNCNGANTYPTTDNNLITGTSACSYAWDETGTAETIASSTTVVANEALILKFAATPNIVTPTGAYTAQANFIATPTY
jgi:hypothetical protein